MVRNQKEIRMHAASSFCQFSSTRKLTHRLDSGIDSGSAQIFAFCFIGVLCSQRSWRKNVRKKRDEIETLRTNALFCLRNAGIMHAVASLFQCFGQGETRIDV